MVQIQEIRTQSIQKSRQSYDEYSYLYPAIADHVVDVFTNGANLPMRRANEPVGEADTSPHQSSMTGLILNTLRGDVNEGVLSVWRKDAIPAGGPFPRHSQEPW